MKAADLDKVRRFYFSGVAQTLVWGFGIN